MDYTKTKDDYVQHLDDTLQSLSLSCRAFDQGHFYEAPRIATGLRVLLHQTKRSHSLLSLLGWQSKMMFFNSGYSYDEKNLMGHQGLVEMRLNDSYSGYAPILGQLNIEKLVNFDTWWNAIVLSDTRKNTFSRADVVKMLANKDGGAHVDPCLPKAYADISRHRGLGFTLETDESSEPALKIEAHTVRQICHELFLSYQEFQKAYSDEID